jgi:hypothetical protein
MSFTESLFRIDDTVIFKRGQDYYPTPGDPPMDRAKGVVVGKNRVTRIEERYGFVSREPGIWVRDGSCQVKWDHDGSVTTPNAYKLEMVNRKEFERRAQQRREETALIGYTACDDKYENAERIGDLPVTKGWELDYIRMPGRWRDHYKFGRISRIDYNIGDSEREVAYYVDLVDEYRQTGHGSTYVNEAELEVVERGNVYKFFNNQPLVFVDLKDEASFFTNIGHSAEVRHPENGNYGWGLEDVLRAISDDIVDGFAADNDLFSFGHGSLRAMRWRNRELGKRIQQATLNGFGSLDKPAIT